MDASLADILTASSLMDHYPKLLRAGMDTRILIELHQQGRVHLLQRLKDVGVDLLPARQAIATAIGKYCRDGLPATVDEPVSSTSVAAPPGKHTIHLRCVGTLGGDNCPGLGKLRNTTHYTSAKTLQMLYEELRAERGYTQAFHNVRVSVGQRGIMDGDEAASCMIEEGLRVGFIGPNNGG